MNERSSIFTSDVVGLQHFTRVDLRGANLFFVGLNERLYKWLLTFSFCHFRGLKGGPGYLCEVPRKREPKSPHYACEAH